MTFHENSKNEKLSLRELRADTSALMARSGTLPPLLSSGLYCLAAALALVSLSGLVSALACLFRQNPFTAALIESAITIAFFLLLCMLVLPLFLARLRMAGLMWQRGFAAGGEIFYYFTSFKRLRRAWRVGFLTMAMLLCPYMVGALVWQLRTQAVGSEILSLLTLLAFLLPVLLFFLSLPLLPFTAVAVGNEQLRVREALFLAAGGGKRAYGAVLRFSLWALLHLLIGLCTVGVYHLLWFSHYYILSYLRLSMALCSREETSHE